ncbi:MAG: branched-chain amino acid ABC transporter permease [Actinomycetota bacterium]|nr:branched-chain amino acid ABC transporter permease [Actinomycetota bacterium]
MAQFIVIGLVSGVVYGLAALGLVLVYKGGRIFNFAQGEFGTITMYVLYFFVSLRKWDYFIAVPIALLVGVVLGLLTERWVVRPLRTAPKVVVLVGTAGVALFLSGLEFLFAGVIPKTVQGPLSKHGPTIAGFVTTQQNVFALVVLIAVALSTTWFFRKTYLGMAILANSQDTTASRLAGVNTNRISAITWGIAGFLGALTGVILSTDVAFYPGFMTTIVLIPAFTAAVVGGITSVGGAFAGGLIVGLVEALGAFLSTRFPGLSIVPELSLALVFIVLLLMLSFRPRGLFGAET